MAKKRISRRRFLGSSTAALLAASLPFPLRALAEGSRSRRSAPGNGLNVMFITADDMGWKDLSCYGNTNIQTPHLDKLAAEGIKFDRAFGVTSSCSSARASFITGQYISTHGVDGLVHRHLSRQLKPFRKTMPGYFRKAGYHTAIEGKWHVSLLPTAFYGYREALGPSLIWKRHITDSTNVSRYLLSRAKDRKPFYLEWNLIDTHRKANGQFELDTRFAVNPDSIQVPEWMDLPNWPEIRAELASYYAGVRRTDHLVGLAMDEIRKHGFEKNTIVVFVSDNGSPFPGNKMTVYDRGVGTPLLMRLPGQIAASRVSNAMVSTIDLMPTLLELCGLKSGREVQGQSFARLLLDEKVDRHREHVFSEMNYHIRHQPMRSVRTERWKAIENLTDEPIGLGDAEKSAWAQKLGTLPDQPWLRRRTPVELYDLASDPHERVNLAGRPELAEVESSLRRLIGLELDRHDRA